MMSGPRLAKSYVSNYLANDMPARLITYRNHWNLSESDLPDPVEYLSHEPFEMGKWPLLITLVINTRNIVRDGYEYDGDPTFRVTYEMRTYIWCRDVGAQTVTDHRDNLTTVVREALMDNPSLSEYDTTVPCHPKIDESTIREEFSDLTLLKGERLLAGSYIAYDLTLDEVIDHDAVEGVGVMQAAEATVYKLAASPNAPINLIATAGDTEVDLSWISSSWNGGVYEISGYQIQQSEDAGATWTTAVADTESAVDLTYTVTGLTNGTEYIFRVAALNNAGVGAYSASSVSVTPTDD